jgi:uncharacterized protein
MKPSFYNTYYPLEEGSYILHNKLTGALMTIDEETKEIIDNIQEREDIPEDIICTLKENGLVLENNEDEFLKFTYRRNEVCYNPQHLSFVFAPTARCNLSCCYCVQRIDESLVDSTTQTVTMSESTVNGVLRFVKNMAETCNAISLPVSFHGGEPLMAKQVILHMLQNLNQWCKERSINFLTNFVTNCTLFDQSFLDELQGLTVGSVRTTLDGPERIHDLYRHYRNGKGTYQQIVTNMGMLLDAGIKVKVQININKYYTCTPELFDDLKERGLTDIAIELYPAFDPMKTISEIQKIHHELDESFPVPESQFAIPFKEVPEARVYVYQAACERGFMLPSSPLGIWTPCDGARAYNFVVGPSGEVYKCEGSILMKNLRVGYIQEDGSFEKYPFFYKWMNNSSITAEKCQTCQSLPSCGGGCIVARYVSNVPYLCEISRFPGEEYLKMCLKQQYPALQPRVK